MTINITFFGAEGAGKTKLINRMLNPNLPISNEPEPTAGGLYYKKSVNDIELHIWDVGGSERYRVHRPVFFRGADIVVYCVDLSLRINNVAIDKDIEAFRATNKEATLLLVGTKSDQAPNPDEKLASVTNQAFAARFYLSSQDNAALELFYSNLVNICKGRLPKKVTAMNINDVALTKTNLFFAASEKLTPQSPLYVALESLRECLIDLPRVQYNQIGQQAVILVEALNSSQNSEQLSNAIQAFKDNCYPILKGQPPYVKNLVLSVVAAAVVTVFVAALGFGFGFLLGIWAGPMAFFSAITTSYAAISIVAASAAAGTIAGLITTYGLFNQSTRETQAIDEVSEAASKYRPPLYSEAASEYSPPR